MHHIFSRFSLRYLGLLLFYFQALNFISAQIPAEAVFFENPPLIDGSIDDEVWKNASPVSGFFQREPNTGQTATERTEVFIGYDQDNLYIGFRCYGDTENIIAKELARDVSLANDDRVQIILDTYLDKRNAFWFQVGPRGSIGDGIVSENGAAFNKAWDGLWTGKAEIHANGWDAELSIPFKTLSFKKGLDTWGIKLIRYDMHRQETSYWPEANLDSYKFQVSDAGLLGGIGDISQGLGLDVIPYGLTGADYKREDGKTEPVLNAGFDAYYNITSNLKAALTVNTDFAQTEVDAQEINLTRFNLFYPEKRDFFLDGANYFNFGINGDRLNSWNTRLIPFFSRRIGLDSLGNPIPLQYGGKITGQAGKWNVGAMYMKDDRKDWQNSHFAVTRLTRTFGDQSHVGIISTYGNALYDTSNFVIGLDMKLGTSKFMGSKNLAFVIYGLKSITDNRYSEVESKTRDLSFGAEIIYPNDLLSFRIGHMQIQENFVAGIGFVPRPGVRQTYGEFLFGPRPEKWGILQILTGAGGDIITDFSNVLLTREIDITPLHIRFVTGDEFEYHIAPTFENLENSFNIYNDIIIPAGNHSFLWQSLSLSSAGTRDLFGSLKYRFGGFYDGNRNEVRLMGGYKIVVPLFLGGEIIRNNVNLPEGAFIANIYRLNLNVLFSPDITLYSYIQYDDKSEKIGWQSRFQWIIQPGKEIFLVWNSIISDPYERYQIQEANVRLKVKYTIRF